MFLKSTKLVNHYAEIPTEYEMRVRKIRIEVTAEPRRLDVAAIPREKQLGQCHLQDLLPVPS